MAQFGFGQEQQPIVQGGGWWDTAFSDGPGRRLKEYTASGELGKDVEEAIGKFQQGDGSGFLRLRAKLAQLGVGPQTTNSLIQNHLEEQAMAIRLAKAQKDRQAQDTERERRAGEYKSIMTETTPRPEFEQITKVPPADLAQFGIGPQLQRRIEDNDAESGIEPGTITEYRPGSPGRALTPNDMFRMAGPDVVADPQKFDNIVRMPGQMAADQALAEQRTNEASKAKIQGRIEELRANSLEGMRGQSGEPDNQQLALHGNLAQRIPQRERPDDPLLEDRRKLLQAQTDRARRPPVTAAGGRGGTPLLREYISMGGDPDDEEAYFEFLQRRSGSTRAPRQTPTGDNLEARMAIGQTIDSPAYQQADDATKQQMLDATASQFGYRVLGKPQRAPKPNPILGLIESEKAKEERLAKFGESFSLAPLKSTEGRAQPQQPPANPAPAPAKAMASMPDPKAHAGKVLRDTATGKRYKSDGKQWVPIS